MQQKTLMAWIIACCIVVVLALGTSLALIHKLGGNTPLASSYPHNGSRLRHEYEVTPDGKWKEVLQIKPNADQTIGLTLQRVATDKNTAETWFKGTFPNTREWVPVGISSDGNTLYVLAGDLAPENNLLGSWIDLYKLQAGDVRLQSIKHWYGIPMDIYVQKDRMLLMIMDRDTHTQTLVLTDLNGNTIQTYYKGQWTDLPNGNLGLQDQHNGLAWFNYAVMDSLANKAVVIDAMDDQEKPIPGWFDITILDLRSGDKQTVNLASKYLWILGWSDPSTLLLSDTNGQRSTIPLAQ